MTRLSRKNPNFGIKNFLFIVLIVLYPDKGSGQTGFGECIIKSLTNVDSLVGDTLYNSRHWQDCVMNKEVPNVKFTTVSGKNIQMSQLRGKIIILNFWFIHCQPCIAELPGLNKLVAEYKKRNVLFFAITFQTLKSIKEDFLPKYHFDFELVHDGTNFTDQFAAGYPTTYIVDQQGVVRAAWNGGFEGSNPDSVFLKARPVIEKLLSGNSTIK